MTRFPSHEPRLQPATVFSSENTKTRTLRKTMSYSTEGKDIPNSPHSDILIASSLFASTQRLILLLRSDPPKSQQNR